MAEFAIEKEGAPIIIPVETEFFDGDGAAKAVVLQMLLDTGASHTMFDAKYRAALGAPIGKSEMHTVGRPVNVDMFRLPRMHLGKLSVKPKGHVACLDMTQSRAIVDQPIDGVIGMDVLSLLVLSINFDEGLVRVHRVVDEGFGERVVIARDCPQHPRCPVVRCNIGIGEQMQFLIDTGGASVLSGGIRSDAYDRLVERRKLRPAAAVRNFKLPAGAAYLRYGRTNAFALGRNAHEDLLFGRFPINCLGLGYLSRYIVAFDFPNNVMYLKRGAGFSRNDGIYLAGMRVAKRGNAVVVVLVAAGGAATAVGIRQGDEIISVDGKPARNLTIMSMRRRLCEQGPLTLGIRRRDTEHRVTLQLLDESRGGN